MVSSSFPHIILDSVSSRGNGNQHLIIGDLFVNKGCQKGELEKTELRALVGVKCVEPKQFISLTIKSLLENGKQDGPRALCSGNGIANIATGD